MSTLFQAILKGSGDVSSRTLSPSPPTHRSSRPVSVSAPFVRTPGKQLIPLESVQLSRTLGEGEFGVVQQGIWTTDTGEKVSRSLVLVSVSRVPQPQARILSEIMISRNCIWEIDIQTLEHFLQLWAQEAQTWIWLQGA